MKYKKSIRGFVEAMAELVEHQVTGHVVLITERGDWGKFLIGKGNIYSVSLGDYRGLPVLEYLKPMDEIQYMFRPDREGVVGGGSAHKDEAGMTAMDNATFFDFFDYVPPKSTMPRQALPASTMEKSAATRSRATILVVDDSALSRKVVGSLLITEGYKVVEAKDGFEAMGQLEIVKPELIILDLIMPKMDGYQVVGMMKNNPAYRKIPIIMLTSRDSLMDKLKGKMSATDAYITKPVKVEELMMHISRQLG